MAVEMAEGLPLAPSPVEEREPRALSPTSWGGQG